MQCLSKAGFDIYLDVGIQRQNCWSKQKVQQYFANNSMYFNELRRSDATDHYGLILNHSFLRRLSR